MSLRKIPSLQAACRMIRHRSLLEGLLALSEAHGEAFWLAWPGFRALVAAGPHAARTVLLEERGRFRSRIEGDPVVRLFRHGLLVTDGDLHEALRREIEPFLRGPGLARWVPRILHRTDERISRWVVGDRVDLLEELRLLTLGVLMESLFNLSIEEAHLPPLARMLKAAVAYISPGLWLLWKNGPRRIDTAALDHLDRQIDQWIQDRRRESRRGEDLLSHWTRCEWMDDALIRDQLITLLIAGHDTVTAWLAWTLALLLTHPAEMEQVQAEIRRVVGDRPPTFEDLRRLPLLDAAARESMRLYPPIPVLNRIASASTSLEGLAIPSGVRVMIPIYALHRRSDRWEEAHCFRPERFRNPAAKPSGGFDYLPFGGGPRFCVGASFAWMEGRIILIRILQRARMEPAFRERAARLGATLEPRDGVPVKICELRDP